MVNESAFGWPYWARIRTDESLELNKRMWWRQELNTENEIQWLHSHLAYVKVKGPQALLLENLTHGKRGSESPSPLSSNFAIVKDIVLKLSCNYHVPMSTLSAQFEVNQVDMTLL